MTESSVTPSLGHTMDVLLLLSMHLDAWDVFIDIVSPFVFHLKHY